MAVAALIWAACGNEDFLENNPGNEAAKPVLMTFTADVPQTRTQLAASNKVYWVEYDEIALWDGSEAYQKLMVDAKSIDGSRATFSGPAIPGADYTAFYPLDEERLVSFSGIHEENRMMFLFDLLFRALEGDYTLGNFIYLSQVLSLILGELYQRERKGSGEGSRRVTDIVRYMVRHLGEPRSSTCPKAACTPCSKSTPAARPWISSSA